MGADGIQAIGLAGGGATERMLLGGLWRQAMPRKHQQIEPSDRPEAEAPDKPRVEHAEVVSEYDGVCCTRNIRVWERRRPSGETVRGTHEIGSVSEPMS